ncbi:hypothetical protein [Spongiactinospora sp. TRM90649]|uniref:hypothetical protein n=1 Tax=Spongiactinospora sp. TRM90649 TaxID=3031114 RepID=UPI0023F644CD|nr:hypothetical protein [Spongiactinospora sp. TRM90649]MDF5753066.1 hypothetical protein [Spongiactinospora sp. TRM90649]
MRIHRTLGALVGAALLLVTAGAVVAPSAQAGTASTAVSLDPPTVSSTSWYYIRAFSNPPYVSQPVAVSVTGGVPPYSYAWQKISGDYITSAANPTGSSTGWSRPIPPRSRSGEWSSEWRCLVTDSRGIMAYTPTVHVSFIWENGD